MLLTTALHFDRLCLGAWTDHGERTGGFYACNRYETAKQEGVVGGHGLFYAIFVWVYLEYFGRALMSQFCVTNWNSELRTVSETSGDGWIPIILNMFFLFLQLIFSWQ